LGGGTIDLRGEDQLLVDRAKIANLLLDEAIWKEIKGESHSTSEKIGKRALRAIALSKEKRGEAQL